MRYFALMIMLAVVLTGCATPVAPPASVNIAGQWSGSWEGYGVFFIKRHDVASARFQHKELGAGSGRIWLDGALASESVPFWVRMAGLDGLPVFFEISGNKVTLRDQSDGALVAEFVVTGDRMIGHPLNTEDPARIVLDRVVAPTAVAPPPAPVSPPAVAAPAPPPVAMPAPPPPPPAAEPVPPAPPARLPSPKDFAPTDALKAVYFDFDRADIRPSEVTVLDGNVRWLQANPDVLVLIEGHCDERGTDAYNLALGDRRAKAVHSYLVAQGVAADRLTTVSYGEQQPACRESNVSCWAQNRRAVLVITPK